MNCWFWLCIVSFFFKKRSFQKKKTPPSLKLAWKLHEPKPARLVGPSSRAEPKTNPTKPRALTFKLHIALLQRLTAPSQQRKDLQACIFSFIMGEASSTPHLQNGKSSIQMGTEAPCTAGRCASPMCVCYNNTTSPFPLYRLPYLSAYVHATILA